MGTTVSFSTYFAPGTGHIYWQLVIHYYISEIKTDLRKHMEQHQNHLTTLRKGLHTSS